MRKIAIKWLKQAEADPKAAAKNLLDEIRDMVSSQQIPPPAELRNKCFDCEYRNFCGDIF